jgi:hypothetical protein
MRLTLPGAPRARRPARPRGTGGAPRVSSPKGYTVVLSPAAKRAIERDPPEALAAAVSTRIASWSASYASPTAPTPTAGSP